LVAAFSCPDIETKKRNMRKCAADVLTILLGDSVVACCEDYNGVTSFGNILTSTVDEIMHSEKYLEFKKSLACGNAPDFCLKNCLTY
jgi:hypothetical protein